jgi:hypothetical protein
MRRAALLTVTALCGALAPSCKGDDGDVVPQDSVAREDSAAPQERCLDVGDEDGDGLDNCQDPDCTEACAEACGNLIDDDADGLVDCADEECAAACVEDCADDLDNDQDGLKDCADDDCLDSCAEDCDDTFDNDEDGAIDCADDECLGAAECPDLYTVTSTLTLTDAQLQWGEGVEHFVGYAALARVTGAVSLDAVAADGSGFGFTCNGQVYGFPSLYDAGYGELEYLGLGEDGCEGCDYRFEMRLSVSNGGVIWSGACPLVPQLPTVQLGFFLGSGDISRYDATTGEWPLQYRADASYLLSYDYGYGMQNTRIMSEFKTMESTTWEVRR